jgi:signal-transduction protein with cAMP-binding, CBS, and nucleotidyltransferase domain
MTTQVPKVSSQTTVLEATNVMKKNRSSGVVVFEGQRVLGLVTDRRLLHDFFPLNKKPDEVKVSEVTGPFVRIGPDATTKEAAKKIVDYGITRLGVFDGEKFLGWVTAIDISRHFSRKNLLDRLRSHDEPEAMQVMCPTCRLVLMEKLTDRERRIVWQCPKCGYAL